MANFAEINVGCEDQRIVHWCDVWVNLWNMLLSWRELTMYVYITLHLPE